MNASSKESMEWVMYWMLEYFQFDSEEQKSLPRLLDGMTPFHLASLSAQVESKRSRDWYAKNQRIMLEAEMAEELHWYFYADKVPGGIDVCFIGESPYHVGQACGCGESGREDFSCLFCEMEFGVYHG